MSDCERVLEFNSREKEIWRKTEIFDNGIVGETEHPITNYMALWQGDRRYPQGGVGERGRVPVSPSSAEFVTSKICGLNRLRLPASPLPLLPVEASGEYYITQVPSPKSSRESLLTDLYIPASSLTCYSASICFILGMYNTKSYREKFLLCNLHIPSYLVLVRKGVERNSS